MGMIEIGPHDEIKNLYNKPANRKLKYCAVIFISITIALLLVRVIWVKQISDLNVLFLKGVAALFTIIFAVLYGVLVYRVNREYISKRR